MRANLVRSLVLVAICSIGLAVVVVVICTMINNMATSSARMGPNAHVPAPKPPLSSGTIAFFATTAFVIAFAKLGTAAWGRRQTTEAWRIGAEGERATAARLESGAAQGWIALHDRRLGTGKENIDHIVVTPSGVAVVESKSWTGKVLVTPKGLWLNGRSRLDVLEQVQRQEAAVRARLQGVDPTVGVGSVVCVHRARIEWRRNLVNLMRGERARPRGIRISSARALRKTLSGPPVLDGPRMAELARVLDSAFPPAGDTD